MAKGKSSFARKADAIAKRQGEPVKNARAELAYGARHASAAAKRKNPNLKKVRGA